MKHLLPAALILAGCAVSPPRFPLDASVARLERDVRFLASDEMKGRNNGTPEGAATAEYVAKQMEDAGLKPAGENGTWFQTLKNNRGRNVIGALPGLSGRWIVVGAHHDGLGERQGRIYNGADDNASGVAVILEVARRVQETLRHGVLFCSFDAEEDGLVGSSHFVKSGLYPVESFVAMICLDLVGGSFLPGDEKRVFALGSESSKELFDRIDWERLQNKNLQVERAGIYAIEPMGPVMARSDYSPFRLKKVPFVFFSTGTPWYYHKPEDDVERLDFAKMSLVADLVARVARSIDHPPPKWGDPVWREPAPNVEEDAQLLASACRRVLEDPAIRATDRQRAAVAEALESLTGKGEIKKETVQQVMALLFVLAGAQKPAH